MSITTMSEAIAAYDEALDEAYPETPFGIPASRILRECDPSAYRVGFADWADAEGIDTDELEDDAELP